MTAAKKKTAKPRKAKATKEEKPVSGTDGAEQKPAEADESARPPMTRGRKLTPDQVREIRVLIGKGRKSAEIADLFGLHPSSVDDIRLRRTWANLD